MKNEKHHINNKNKVNFLQKAIKIKILENVKDKRKINKLTKLVFTNNNLKNNKIKKYVANFKITHHHFITCYN